MLPLNWSGYSSLELGADSYLVLPCRSSSVRYTHITEYVRKTNSAVQIEVKEVVTTADNHDEEATRLEQDETEALRQFEEEHKVANASRRPLAELQSKT
ncbi:hypothetical protein CC78DRAFT_588292 [Lojkania enalia]|uniref:Uncharacterized protein n=1 Tax=Lojkania enalia TaxID=147567 RepID=A0A9P4JXH0_9PLEO|nr:hypothetical protein CC78DRAFT_588292 [Didymosphaeria enalia]